MRNTFFTMLLGGKLPPDNEAEVRILAFSSIKLDMRHFQANLFTNINDSARPNANRYLANTRVVRRRKLCKLCFIEKKI